MISIVFNFVVGIRCLTTAELQQCTANLACSIDYRNVFQTKLDNATHFLELELALLRHQTNALLVPLETKVNTLEANYSQQVTASNLVLGKLQNEVSNDR